LHTNPEAFLTAAARGLRCETLHLDPPDETVRCTRGAPLVAAPGADLRYRRRREHTARSQLEATGIDAPQ